MKATPFVTVKHEGPQALHLLALEPVVDRVCCVSPGQFIWLRVWVKDCPRHVRLAEGHQADHEGTQVPTERHGPLRSQAASEPPPDPRHIQLSTSRSWVPLVSIALDRDPGDPVTQLSPAVLHAPLTTAPLASEQDAELPPLSQLQVHSDAPWFWALAVPTVQV